MIKIKDSQWVCAGTKRISITTEKDSNDVDGMVTVYRRPHSPAHGSSHIATDDDVLHVVITDGCSTFYERISIKEIRNMSSDEGHELEKVMSILLCPDDGDDDVFKVLYKRVEGQLFGDSYDSSNTTTRSVKVSVRKACQGLSQGVVRPVWEGQCDDMCRSRCDDLPLFARNAFPEELSRKESSSGVIFPVMLGDAANVLLEELAALRTQNKTLEADTLRWKSTADKLSQTWEDEKSELTDRFLTLFNEHKARHVETLNELKVLKGQPQRAVERSLGTTASDRETIRPRIGKEAFPDYEDDQELVEYDDAFVARLAASRGTARGGRAAKAAGYVNPHTGATEFDDPKEMFSSSDDEDNVMSA